jgi:hypothetical protein
MIAEAGKRSNRDGTIPGRETSNPQKSKIMLESPIVEKRGRRDYT